MYLFKTSGATFNSVIRNQKHAFKTKPRDWEPGEIVLVSKNKQDCASTEKQISFTMRLRTIRETTDAEINDYWPGNPGRWNYIVDCTGTEQVPKPFNLSEILGEAARIYDAVMTFRKVDAEHEALIAPLLALPSSNSPDEITSTRQYIEGASCSISVNAYERNAAARESCIAHYGLSCKACDFSFAERYGELGSGFIHVHHIVPLADIGKSYKVDPISDLIPLCANCHAMIHRRRPTLTLNELKEHLMGAGK
jgi:hypothetical protein